MRTFGPNDLLFILSAARWTLALSLIAFVGGAIGGLVVALLRTSDLPWLRNASAAFIQLFQGTPLLLQLFLIFFGAPVLGLDINPWIAAGDRARPQQQRLPRPDLARLHRGDPARAAGGRRFAQPLIPRPHA